MSLYSIAQRAKNIVISYTFTHLKISLSKKQNSKLIHFKNLTKTVGE